MSIPDYQTLMLPLLKFLGHGEERSVREAIEALAAEFGLTAEERQRLVPSGQQPLFENRVGWARTYLKKAGLLEAPRRGFLRITERGQRVLQQNRDRIDVNFLMQFAEFREFRAGQGAETSGAEPLREEVGTPEERLASVYQQLKEELARELLERLQNSSPSFFERLVLRLLVAMGYGGSFEEAARAVGRSGDEGIDGIINEDRLGLDTVYVQAKRWTGLVGRPEVQKFAGALQAHKARKGIFITTSKFTREAEEFVSRVESKIVLIDGKRLAELMMEYDVGVTTTATYKVKKVDSDFFSEE